MARHWYALSTGPGGAAALVVAVLTAVRPDTERAEVRDRDLAPGAPAAAVTAWAALAGPPARGLVAAVRRAVGAAPVVWVSAADDDRWARLAVCAPWLTAVDLLGRSEGIAGRIHDAGCRAVVELPAERGDALGRELGPAVAVERLPDKRAWYRMGQ